MSERKYYLICDDDCRFEGMTKEQIMAAIAEATGNTPVSIDEAFITKIKELNGNTDLTFWKGTQAEFNALGLTDTDRTLLCVGADGKLYITDYTFNDEVQGMLDEYLPLSGGTLTGALKFSGNGRGIYLPLTAGQLAFVSSSDGSAFNVAYIKEGSTSWTNTLFKITPSSDGSTATATFTGNVTGHASKDLPITAGQSYPLTGSLFTQTVVPKTDNTYNLGSSASDLRYKDGYINNIYSNGINLNGTKAKITNNNSGNVHLAAQYSSTTSGYTLEFGVIDSAACLLPTGLHSSTASTVDLGKSDARYRWRNTYLAAAANVSSDRNEKNTIEDVDKDFALKFIKALKPSTYKYNSGTSGRIHHGFIAQDVEETLLNLGKTPQDFAGLCIDEHKDAVDGKIYGLRYEEFISPLTKVVQHLVELSQTQQKEIEELKSRIKALEDKEVTK